LEEVLESLEGGFSARPVKSSYRKKYAIKLEKPWPTQV